MNKNIRTSGPFQPRGSMTLEVFVLGLDECTRDLNSLEDYLTLTTRFLDEKRRSFEDTYRDVMNDPDFCDAMHDEVHQLWHGFPSTLLGSTFVAACSCLEASIVDVCKNLQSHGEFNIAKPWDPKGRGSPLDKAVEFLKVNFQLYLGEHEAWSRLRDYYLLRNCVVHATGDVELMANSADIQQAAGRQKKNGIDIDEGNRLVVSSNFVSHVLNEMSAFWSSLGAALRENAIIGPLYWP